MWLVQSSLNEQYKRNNGKDDEVHKLAATALHCIQILLKFVKFAGDKKLFNLKSKFAGWAITEIVIIHTLRTPRSTVGA